MAQVRWHKFIFLKIVIFYEFLIVRNQIPIRYGRRVVNDGVIPS